MQSEYESLRPRLTGKLWQLSRFLRRFTSLNHLASAARRVLESKAQVSSTLSQTARAFDHPLTVALCLRLASFQRDAMVLDFNMVDFEAIQAQAELVCPCTRSKVYSIRDAFVSLLQNEVRLRAERKKIFR